MLPAILARWLGRHAPAHDLLAPHDPCAAACLLQVELPDIAAPKLELPGAPQLGLPQIKVGGFRAWAL